MADGGAEAVSSVRPRLGAVVLAAGAGRRFGGHKLSAELEGRPLLQHVLDVLDTIQPVMTVVVMAPDASDLEAISWRKEQRLVNPDPGRGLSSSLQLGVDRCAADGHLDGAFILLGDQPRTAVSTLVALSEAAREVTDDVVAIVPDYAGGGGANPVLLLRAGFSLVTQVSGDRGLSSLLAARSDRVRLVALPGFSPDVDTVADLRDLEAGS